MPRRSMIFFQGLKMTSAKVGRAKVTCVESWQPFVTGIGTCQELPPPLVAPIIGSSFCRTSTWTSTLTCLSTLLILYSVCFIHILTLLCFNVNHLCYLQFLRFIDSSLWELLAVLICRRLINIGTEQSCQYLRLRCFGLWRVQCP